MDDKETISMIYNGMFDLKHSCYYCYHKLRGPLLGTTKRCMIASELPPDEWPEEVLWPLSPSNPPIFGWPSSLGRDKSMSLIDSLVSSGLSSSNGEARKSIRNNSVMINRVKCNDISRILTSEDRLPKLDAIV